MTVPYILKRSRKRRRTISLQITRQSDLVVSAPYFTPTSEINLFIRQKFDWIQRNIEKQKEERIKAREKEYLSGEIFYYLGKPYPLEVDYHRDEQEHLIFWSDHFYLNCPDDFLKKKYYFMRWYRKKAEEYFRKRVDTLSTRTELQPRRIKISSAGKRWGSCSEENNIALSFRLIMAAPDVIDYVIIHELAHIKEKNHSPKFWKLVEWAMPEYKRHRSWLRDNGSKLCP